MDPNLEKNEFQEASTFLTIFGTPLGFQLGSRDGANIDPDGPRGVQKPPRSRPRAAQKPLQEPRAAPDPSETSFWIIFGAILTHGPMGYPPSG